MAARVHRIYPAGESFLAVSLIAVMDDAFKGVGVNAEASRCGASADITGLDAVDSCSQCETFSGCVQFVELIYGRVSP